MDVESKGGIMSLLNSVKRTINKYEGKQDKSMLHDLGMTTSN